MLPLFDWFDLFDPIAPQFRSQGGLYFVLFGSRNEAKMSVMGTKIAPFSVVVSNSLSPVFLPKAVPLPICPFHREWQSPSHLAEYSDKIFCGALIVLASLW